MTSSHIMEHEETWQASSHQVVGTANVLDEGIQYRAVVMTTLHQVAEKLSHEHHIGDVGEEDGGVGQSKHHSTFRPLHNEYSQ